MDIEDSSHNIGNDTSIYHQENDQEDEEDRSHFNGNGYSSYNQKYKATVSNDEEDWSDSVTRCICDFQHDDGFMISCDRCWLALKSLKYMNLTDYTKLHLNLTHLQCMAACRLYGS